jgi:hypothetical protein
MRATAQERKRQVLAERVDARTRLLDLAISLAPEQRETIFLGTWALSDLVAHLVGRDFTNIQLYDCYRPVTFQRQIGR